MEADLRLHPVALGFLLAPVAGAIGALSFGLLFGFRNIVGLMFFGVIVGSPPALLVTALLFPALHRMGAVGVLFPVLGAALGSVVSALFGMPLSGFSGGLVVGLLFWLLRGPNPASPKIPEEGRRSDLSATNTLERRE